MTTINSRFLLRQDTLENWTNNPLIVPAAGEAIIEKDTHALRLGDGVNKVSVLPRVLPSVPSSPVLDFSRCDAEVDNTNPGNEQVVTTLTVAWFPVPDVLYYKVFFRENIYGCGICAEGLLSPETAFHGSTGNSLFGDSVITTATEIEYYPPTPTGQNGMTGYSAYVFAYNAVGRSPFPPTAYKYLPWETQISLDFVILYANNSISTSLYNGSTDWGWKGMDTSMGLKTPTQLVVPYTPKYTYPIITSPALTFPNPFQSHVTWTIVPTNYTNYIGYPNNFRAVRLILYKCAETSSTQAPVSDTVVHSTLVHTPSGTDGLLDYASTNKITNSYYYVSITPNLPGAPTVYSTSVLYS